MEAPHPVHLLIDLQACQSLVHGSRGIGKYAMSLVRSLLRQAADRRVSFLINGDMEESAAELRRGLLAEVDLHDIYIWTAPFPRNAADDSHRWRGDAARLVRDALIESIAPDCLLITSFFEGWMDNCVCELPSAETGVATAVIVYDLIPYIYEDIYLREPRLRNWYMSMVRHLGDADVILAISGSARQEVLDITGHSPDRVMNISSAVDERYVPTEVPADIANALRAKLGLDKPFVMYTGGIDHRKNIDLLVEAFADTGKFASSHQLAIVCKVHPDERERLKVLARRVGLADDVLILTDFVSDDDLLTLYSLCELFVFPSWHEGFGLPVLEAMSVGAPVIVADSSSLPEVVGPEGLLFDPRNKVSIADAITRVLSDDELRKRLASDGLARSREFSWARTAALAWEGVEKAVGMSQGAVSPTGLVHARGSKPRLAFFSPLPPQRSGIADFSAELLPELAGHYDIELVVESDSIVPDLNGLTLPVRNVDWFLSNAQRFDRVLYHFGNSEFHSYMFDALACVPGTVVLHDFYLGNLHHFLQDTGRRPGMWQRALYEGYGYRALKMLGETADRNVTAFGFPCNWGVVAAADGVVVHSAYSRGLADDWYGRNLTKRFVQMPLLRKVRHPVDRIGGRRALGLREDELVVATFGMLSANKCNDALLEAWLTSFGDRGDCKLVFVGQAADPEWEKALRSRAEKAGVHNVVVTGFADAETYRHWLASTDVAVQLRRQSRGETSAAVLDCFAWGLATIVNAHGSMAELPQDATLMLGDEFTIDDLAAAIGSLIDSKEARLELAEAGRTYLEREHDPARIAAQYCDAIETFHSGSARRILQRVVDRLSAIRSSVAPTSADCDAVALGLSTLLGPAASRPQLLIDVSELVRTDARSGIQRVVRSVLLELLTRPDTDWRIEPVYTDGDGVYRYARQFACTFLGCPLTTLDDDPIDVADGDVFVGLDLVPTGVPAAVESFAALKARGVRFVFVVYDMLPLVHPEWFPPNAPAILIPWYRAVAVVADRVVAISRSVADEFAAWLPEVGRKTPLELSWFHLGADVHASMPSRGVSLEDGERLHQIREKGNIVLMVGTIEPRKGHDQALDAFVRLRARGVSAQLVIVGKQGWCVEGLIERLRADEQITSDVTWFSTASDELLDHLYDSASLLLVASRGEGFGLPIVEAAMRGITVLARDLPVFREVGGEGILYFSGDSADDLAESIEKSLAATHAGAVPNPANVSVNSWSASVEQFLVAATGELSYRTWFSDKICH